MSRSTVTAPLTYQGFQKEAADMGITVYDGAGSVVDCSAATDITLDGKRKGFGGTDYQFEKVFDDFAVSGDNDEILTVNLDDDDRDFSGLLFCILTVDWGSNRRLKGCFRLQYTGTSE